MPLYLASIPLQNHLYSYFFLYQVNQDDQHYYHLLNRLHSYSFFLLTGLKVFGQCYSDLINSSFFLILCRYFMDQLINMLKLDMQYFPLTLLLFIII